MNKTLRGARRSTARWPNCGTHPPPFPAGTKEYYAWYWQVQRMHRAYPHIPRQEFFARAKAEAAANPASVKLTMRMRHRLFHGDRKAYRAWYYRTMQACKSAQADGNPNNVIWSEFFAAARDKAMQEQGLTIGGHTQYKSPVKPHNVIPFNSNRTSTGSVAPRSSSIPADGPLRFDFSVDDPSEREWR